MERYRVRVTKDYLGFCSGHFIFFDDDKCERLHGHNYRVAAELEGPLDENRLVFDFIVLKRVLKGIVDELDHRMLVPMKSRQLRIEHDERSVRMSYKDKEWVFPRGDCALLPIENTTAELLARWVALRLDEALRGGAEGAPRFSGRIRIEVEESPGQSAIHDMAEG
jgi:6-pyruvoyltetrahydropterin/6-carboxytetrahydropterin synthase